MKSGEKFRFSAYLESMKESLRGETSVPGWYLYITGGSIAAGAGVIENDFHDRKDLAPNICSLYVSPKVRRTGIAGSFSMRYAEMFWRKGSRRSIS